MVVASKCCRSISFTGSQIDHPIFVIDSNDLLPTGKINPQNIF